LILGVWLLAGAWARALRAAAIACFSIFAQVALYKALAGEPSCGFLLLGGTSFVLGTHQPGA
jgi:hypothetical protein